MKTLHVVAATLVIVGAVNWGLVAVAQFDLVAALFGMQFGETSPLTSIVYGLVGLAGVYQAIPCTCPLLFHTDGSLSFG
jgi:uncharacterized protein